MRIETIIEALNRILSNRTGMEVRIYARNETQGDISEH